MTVKIVSKKDPITTDHPKTSAVFKSNPIALSQIKCLTPPKKWYQMAQSEQSNTSLPNQLVKIAFAKRKCCSEVAAANSHQIIKTTQKIRALPVIRINIELTEVNCGLYMVKWGDRGLLP